MDKKIEPIFNASAISVVADALLEFAQLSTSSELDCNCLIEVSYEFSPDLETLNDAIQEISNSPVEGQLYSSYHFQNMVTDIDEGGSAFSAVNAYLGESISKGEHGELEYTNFKFQEKADLVGETQQIAFDIKRALSEVTSLGSKNSPLDPKSLQEGIQKNIVARNTNDLADDLVRRANIMIYRGYLYMFNGSYWVPLTLKEFAAEARNIFSDLPETVSCLSQQNYRDIEFSLQTNPDLQKKDADLIKNNDRINCIDGVIDVVSWECFPHSPNYGFYSQINVYTNDIGQGSGYYFENFIENCTAGDQSLRQLILEMVGVIVSNYSVKKIFHLLGPSNVGKSQLGKLCVGLVGDESNFSIKGLRDLTSRFGTASLVGKKLCSCFDLSNAIIDAETIGILKQLVGDDPIYGEQKYKDPFTFYNQATLLFAGNHPLCVNNMENENAFMQRIVTVPLFNPVPPEKWIPHLSERLIQESGYIIGLALEALTDLKNRNFVFTKVDVPDNYHAVDTHQNDLADFLQLKCEFRDDAVATTESLYKAYCAFCNDTQRAPMRLINFARSLNNSDSNFESKRNVNGSGKRGYKGIGLI